MPGAGDSQIPAGFTYFGQFVDHDITFDRTEGIPDGSLDPEEIEQGRSPALDLDSVYGRGPDELARAVRGGQAAPEDRHDHRPADLRRDRRPSRTTCRASRRTTPRTPKQAIIGDPRNDENLIVAQTHLAFLKFHNKVVDHLQAAGTAADKLFEEARKTVVQHYQSIVLHDFVPPPGRPRRLRRRPHQRPESSTSPRARRRGKYLCMPIEFSVAAYRLGHSMIRNAYQWNRVFSSDGVGGLRPGAEPVLRVLAGVGRPGRRADAAERLDRGLAADVRLQRAARRRPPPAAQLHAARSTRSWRTACRTCRNSPTPSRST